MSGSTDRDLTDMPRTLASVRGAMHDGGRTDSKEAGTMAPITLERVSTAEVRERQAKILAALHLSLDEMRERADDFELDARERGLAREYERLEFLVSDGTRA